MYLLFNTLSSFVVPFLQRNKCLSASWLQLPSAVILESPKIVSHCFHFFPINLPWSDKTGCHYLSFLNVEFQANFSLSSLTLIKRLFSSSSPSAVRLVSSAYLRLLIFLLHVLILACDSSSPAFHMMYSAYKYRKPWRLHKIKKIKNNTNLELINSV